MTLLKQKSSSMPRNLLAASFIFYGILHALAFGLFLIVFLALIEFAVGLTEASRMILLLGMLLAAALPSIIAGYALIKRKNRAKPAVLTACVGITCAVLFAASVVSEPHYTQNRIIAITLYAGVSVAICFYAGWFLRQN